MMIYKYIRDVLKMDAKEGYGMHPDSVRKLVEILKNKDWDKWITPEKYKELTGEEWRRDAPVWSRNLGEWRLSEYGGCPHWHIGKYVVIANHHGKPPADFIPEETR